MSYVNGSMVERRSSEVSGSLEVWFLNGRFVLHSVNANYSYDTLHTVFRKTFSQCHVQKRSIGTALILGFGAGSVATILVDELELNPEIIGVEADVVVIELGRKYFNIDRFTRLKLFQMDAKEFILQHHEKYDLIVSDVFVDKDVPEFFVTQEYIEALEKMTSKNGIGFYNYLLKSKTQLQELKKLIDLFSSSVRVLSPSANNRMIVWERN